LARGLHFHFTMILLQLNIRPVLALSIDLPHDRILYHGKHLKYV